MGTMLRGLLLATVFGLTSAGATAAELIVSAAASLTSAFGEIGRAFGQAEPGSTVVLNFGGSGQLLQQIDRGAPVHVFASADQETMDRAQQRGLIDVATRIDFTRNALVVIVPADSGLPFTGLDSLRADGVRRLAISNPDSVPVGRYARDALTRAGLWRALQPRIINTQHVRQSLDYVARGEVDAGFVYSTDAAVMAGKVRIAGEIPTPSPITYPIAAVKDNNQAQLARRFIAFVQSASGQAILVRHGFLRP
jgi:molybdate transport system substrate-binding protein